jgi:hypothetical protein
VSLAVEKSDVAGNYAAQLSGYGETFGSFTPSRDIKMMLTLTPLPASQRAAPAQPSPLPTPAPAEGSTHSPRRQRSRGSRGTYQPPTHQAPAAPAPAPSGDPFRRFD